jgi:hypothetical protein
MVDRDHEYSKQDVDFRVFMAETAVYQTEQAKRMDKISENVDVILDKISVLPCRERSGLYKNIDAQLRTLWAFVSAIVIAVIINFFK